MGHVIAFWLAATYVCLLSFKGATAAIAIRASKLRERTLLPLAPDWMTEVQVLQPILSGDPNLGMVLEDNLVALQDANFLWLVDLDDFSAIEVAERLQKKYPRARLRILRCAPAPDGFNPKTYKLDLGLRETKCPLCLVLDDDARLSASNLARLVQELSVADLVTALPFYRDDAAFPARLTAQFVNNNAALTYLPLLPFTEPISINGMCYLLRSENFRNLGGFAAILTSLADDLAVAHLHLDRQKKIIQSTAMVEVQTSILTLQGYMRQMHRWFLFATLLIRDQPAFMKLCIAFLQGLHPLAIFALLALVGAYPGIKVVIILIVVLGLRSGVICALQLGLTGNVRHRFWISLLSEILQPIHLIHALVRRTIHWRTRVYRVHRNDDFHIL